MRVAFQGEFGAYSEEAIINHWGESVDPVPYPRLVDVFKSVENGETEVGLVPVENTIEGSVVRTLDLLKERSLLVNGETILRIVHCLIVNDGVEKKDIKRVFSHPQALGQSRAYLESHEFEAVSFYDTAGSVKYIRDNRLMDSAAIASSRAAKVYDMKIIAQGLETDKANYTRFLIIGFNESKPTGSDKTSIAFIVPNECGALCKALETITGSDINITMLEPRPLIGHPWEYVFFIDFNGHILEDEVNRSIIEMKKHTRYFKHLGSYARAT